MKQEILSNCYEKKKGEEGKGKEKMGREGKGKHFYQLEMLVLVLTHRMS
jgi:hypothetical protein